MKAKRSSKSVKSLKPKKLTAKQTKRVKGGIIIIGGSPIQEKWIESFTPVSNKVTKW